MIKKRENNVARMIRRTASIRLKQITSQAGSRSDVLRGKMDKGAKNKISQTNELRDLFLI